MSDLPSARLAAAEPGVAREAVQALVKASLQEQWRNEHQSEDFLADLVALTRLHLGSLAAPGEGTFEGAAAEHEEACAACLKLARNLCFGGRRDVQELLWRSGLVDELMEHLKVDARLPDERDPAWCEAVPSFLTNSIAANEELRARAVDAWFPFAVANACTLSSRRPELAFALVQTLLPSSAEGGGGAARRLELLSDTENGHCVLFVLASLLFRGGVGMSKEREVVSEKAWEWASVVMHGLFASGGFARSYVGVRELTVEGLHSFWINAVGCPEGVRATAPAGVLERLVGRLCHKAEVLGLFWHSVGALDSPQISERLLGDPEFAGVAAEELATALSRLAEEWKLAWRPLSPLPAEACQALGVQQGEVDLRALAREREDGGGEAPQEDGDGEGGAVGSIVFGELASALVALSGGPGARFFPPRLAAVCLVGCVSCLDALHRLRFGEDVEAAVAKKVKPPKEATEAARACDIVEQVRLCANLLYDKPEAQDFLRHIGGLRVLLSHCYSDGELPLLREVGIFAVRNATHGCPENQQVMKGLLAARTEGGPSSDVFDPVTGELTPADIPGLDGLD